MGPIPLFPCYPQLPLVAAEQALLSPAGDEVSKALVGDDSFQSHWVMTPFRVIGSFLPPCIQFWTEKIWRDSAHRAIIGTGQTALIFGTLLQFCV